MIVQLHNQVSVLISYKNVLPAQTQHQSFHKLQVCDLIELDGLEFHFILPSFRRSVIHHLHFFHLYSTMMHCMRSLLLSTAQVYICYKKGTLLHKQVNELSEICAEFRIYSFFSPPITHNKNGATWQSCDKLHPARDSTDLCEDIKTHIGRKNEVNIHFHACELHYILVIFCMSCHRMHVCQMTSGTISRGHWLSNLLCSSRRSDVWEEKQSALKKIVGAPLRSRHLVKYVCHFDIWSVNASRRKHRRRLQTMWRVLSAGFWSVWLKTTWRVKQNRNSSAPAH